MAITGIFLAMWRMLVARPLGRLSAVEAQGAAIEIKVDGLSNGIDEIRVAQARSSDQNREQLHELSTRIDKVLEMIAHMHGGR